MTEWIRLLKGFIFILYRTNLQPLRSPDNTWNGLDNSTIAALKARRFWAGLLQWPASVPVAEIEGPFPIGVDPSEKGDKRTSLFFLPTSWVASLRINR